MSTYNKTPFFPIAGNSYCGWELIIEELRVKIKNSDSDRYVLVVECYQGVNHGELLSAFGNLNPELFMRMKKYRK
jgi:hypothetical protein